MLPNVGVTEMVLLGVVAILLFGSRLPEVARNIGRSYGELRRGLTELKATINTEIDSVDRQVSSAIPKKISADTTAIDDYDEPSAPRLIPPVRKS
jgi:sec-independent protein translocase protein TatA